MINEIYNSKILEFAAHIDHLGRLENPDASAKKHSKLCGSTIIVDLKMQNGKVTDYAQDVRACALGQASASILARHIIGASAEQLRSLHHTMWLMLTENGAPPVGIFSDFSALQPVKDYKARHASTMLVLDAVLDCLQQIETPIDGQNRVS